MESCLDPFSIPSCVQEVTPANGHATRAEPQSSETNPSPGFLCPLTGIIMRDPVVLDATLISYEREAITWWLQAYPGRCPVTGRPVEEAPSLTPDDELRTAITTWAARYAPHLMVRPIAAQHPSPVSLAILQSYLLCCFLHVHRARLQDASCTQLAGDEPHSTAIPWQMRC